LLTHERQRPHAKVLYALPPDVSQLFHWSRLRRPCLLTSISPGQQLCAGTKSHPAGAGQGSAEARRGSARLGGG